jgi:drug/metabolite transporter (DMT)-like permease
MSSAIITNEFSSRKKRISEFYLVLTTALWGTTFIVTKETAQIIPPFFYMMIRFLISGASFFVFIKHFRGFTKKHLKISFFAGFYYFLSNATQTIGIVMTNASKASFITGLNVIMIPIFIALIFKKKVKRNIWISVILATIGIACLSLTDAEGYSGFNLGDLSVFFCAVFWAIYVIYIDKYLNEIDIIAFSSVHMIFVGFFNGFISLIFEDWFGTIIPSAGDLFSTQIWLAILYVSIIATCFALIFQF